MGQGTCGIVLLDRWAPCRGRRALTTSSLLKNMPERDIRFYAANVGAAALFVNGVETPVCFIFDGALLTMWELTPLFFPLGITTLSKSCDKPVCVRPHNSDKTNNLLSWDSQQIAGGRQGEQVPFPLSWTSCEPDRGDSGYRRCRRSPGPPSWCRSPRKFFTTLDFPTSRRKRTDASVVWICFAGLLAAVLPYSHTESKSSVCPCAFNFVSLIVASRPCPVMIHPLCAQSPPALLHSRADTSSTTSISVSNRLVLRWPRAPRLPV